MKLRQIALVARDLDSVVGQLCAVLGVEVAFRDPAVAVFGLQNAVMPVGDTFLEVVSPVTADAPAGRFLRRRGGDSGYMVMVQCEDVAAARRRVAACGVRVAWSIDLDDIAGTHLHPKDTGGAILSLDEARPAASWRWAGPEWTARVRTNVTRAIAGVEIEADDPAAMAARWSRLLDHPLVTGPAGRAEIALDRGRIRFVASRGRGEGVSALIVDAADPARLAATAGARGLARGSDVVICGTRIEVQSR